MTEALPGGTFKPTITDTSLVFEQVVAGFSFLDQVPFSGPGPKLEDTDWAAEISVEDFEGDNLRFELDGTYAWGDDYEHSVKTPFSINRQTRAH